MKRHAKISFLALGSAVAVSAVAGLAWACTGVPSIGISPTAGPAGTDVVIQGALFESDVPVEVRWNSLNGPVIGSGMVNTRSFAINVKVPEVGPGVYPVVAIQKDSLGRIIHKAPRVFEVSSGAAQAATSVSENLWAGYRQTAELGSGLSIPATEPAGSPGAAALGAALSGFGAVLGASGLVLAASRKRQRTGLN